MEKLSDKQTRLFYGATLHARKHSERLKEFSYFSNDFERKHLAENVFKKVKAFQTGKADSIFFTKEEKDICHKLVDMEIALLKRLASEDMTYYEKYQSTLEEFSSSWSILDNASKS